MGKTGPESAQTELGQGINCKVGASEAGQTACTSSAWSLKVSWLFCLLGIGLLAFNLSFSMSWNRLPSPSCHDEFSNLLVADTLLQGRLANPAPAVWQPFQSFHVLVHPQYASKFPLGPGALLALGRLLFGSAAAGIWLGAGLCAAAITWAAAGCLPRRWSLLAGLLVALHPNIHALWSLSYMNGWLTATAGALVAGGVLRMRKRVRYLDALIVGCGVGGLALTRPFEGALFTLTAAGLLLYWWRKEFWLAQFQRGFRAASVAAIPVGLTLALMAVHNQSTTGNIWQLPYQLHEQQYGVAPLSIFQSQKEPLMTEWSADVPPTVLAFHYGWSLDSYLKRNHLSGWCGAIAERFHVVSRLWGLAFCMLTACMAFKRAGPHRPVILVIGVALLMSSFVPWYFSHYFAPSLVWMVLLTVLAVHWMVSRMATDRRLAKTAVALVLATQAVCMAVEVRRANSREVNWADQREAIVQRLSELGGRHLILVRYHADHDVHHEWVYNGADLEQAPIVWARSWRPDLDSQLLEHYPNRTVWVLQLDQQDIPTLTEVGKQTPLG